MQVHATCAPLYFKHIVLKTELFSLMALFHLRVRCRGQREGAEGRALYRRDVPDCNRHNANEELFFPPVISCYVVVARSLICSPQQFTVSLGRWGGNTQNIKDTCMYTRRPFSLLAQARRSMSVPAAPLRSACPPVCAVFLRVAFSTDVEKEII